MTLFESDGLARMQEAVELFLQWKQRPDREPAANFLAAHEDLREMLEPLVADIDEQDAHADTNEVAAGDAAMGERRFGDYRIVRELGRGGMGVVYEASDAKLGRRVALKVLPGAFAQEARAIARFKREAMTAARLEHESIVRVLSVGTHDDIPYFAMDLVEGVPLHRLLHRLRSSGLPNSGSELADLVLELSSSDMTRKTAAAAAPKSATRATSVRGVTARARWKDGYVETLVDLLIQLADAIAHAHEAGIVHRDIKPSNLILRPDAVLVLTDFGLARDIGLPTATQTGDFAGTPHYVSPEQARGESHSLGPASDIFSFGATAYEILTLERAFDGKTTPEVLEAIRRRDPIDPSLRHAVPRDLAAILLKCLEKDPARRYASAHALLDDLRAFRAFRAVTARRPSGVERGLRVLRRNPLEALIVLAGLLVLALLLYLWSTQDDRDIGRSVARANEIEAALERGFVEHYAARQEVARAHFERVLELDPNNVYAICAIVAFIANDKQRDADFANVQRALAAMPDNDALRRLEVTFLAFLKRSEEAKEAYLTLREPTTAEECFVAGALATPTPTSPRIEGAFARATSYYRRAIERSHRARLVHYMQLATTISRHAPPEEIKATAETLRVLWPDSALAHGVIGLTLHKTDDVAAEAAYRRAIELDPGLLIAHSGIAHLYAGQKKHKESIEACKQALSIEVQHAPLLELLADQALRNKDFATALDAARRAIAADPNNAMARVTLATVLERAADPKDPEALRQARLEALEHVRSTAERHPFYETGHRSLTGLYSRLGDATGLRDEYLRWARVNPNGAWAQMELARYLLDLEEPTDEDLALALKAARRSNMLYKTSADLMLVLARAEAALSDAVAARATIARARAHLPEDAAERTALEERLDALEARLSR